MRKHCFFSLIALSGMMLFFLPAVAGASWLEGHRAYVVMVFDSVAIAGTAADTSAAIEIGSSQYQTVFVAADSVGGAGAVDVEIAYELSKDGTNWARPAGDASPKTLISGFTGCNFDEYYQVLQVPFALKIRFIATGTASNSAYTKLKMWLIKQP